MFKDSRVLISKMAVPPFSRWRLLESKSGDIVLFHRKTCVRKSHLLFIRSKVFRCILLRQPLLFPIFPSFQPLTGFGPCHNNDPNKPFLKKGFMINVVFVLY